MATKRKSIIEEALLEAKSLEDALKANTKEMLATHMKQEIENIVESSLKEQEDEEIEIDAVEGSDEEEEVPADADEVLAIVGDDAVDFDFDEDSSEDEVAGLELDLTDIDADIDLDDLEDELGDEEELDLTGASDEEVIAVFKKMGDEDEVEVVKDEDGIHLTDNEAGTEYYIKESEELSEEELCEGCDEVSEETDDEIVYEIEIDEHQSFADRRREREGEDKYLGNTPDDLTPLSNAKQGYDDREDESLGKLKEYGKGSRSKSHPGEEDFTTKKTSTDYHRDGKDVTPHPFMNEYEEGSDSKTHPGEEDFTTKKTSTDYHRDGKDVTPHPFGEGEDEIDENKQPRMKAYGSNKYHGGRTRYTGPHAGTKFANESKKSRKPLSEKRRTPKNAGKVADSKIVKEYKELKAKNTEYKEALKVFKNKLNEVALFNTNLAYVNRLFTEHSTTKNEKMEILKKFDGAESIKESKNIYKSIKGELDTKTPITESVENKVNKTVKSSKSDLNESTAYVDPQIKAIKDLMMKIS